MSAAAAGLLLAAAVGSLLNAGVFFAFSAFVMRALGRLPEADAARAMRAINVEILSSAFMPLFLGTAALAAAAAVWSLYLPPGGNRITVLGGSLIFLVGCLGVTLVANVPLNERLADDSDAGTLWAAYAARWTAWNTARTVAALLAAAAYLYVVTNAAIESAGVS